MSSDSNTTLLKNTVILYVRLACVSLLGFLTTRFALQALGVVDYGLFAVVGSVISFISVVNTMMISSSNRFIAVAVGKGDAELLNRQFNVNLMIHIGVALITLLVAYPVGDWYILHHLKYEGDIEKAMFVYNVTISASIVSFIGVPFNGLLLAKEKFFVFCSTDILSSMAKAVVAYLLIGHFSDKLLIYSLTMAITTAYPVMVFWAYCRARFPEIIRFKVVRDMNAYKEVLSFTFWAGFGTIVQVGRSQFAGIFINYFFGTILNSALGIANSLKNIVDTFAVNLTKPMEPQIVKSYSAGDTSRCQSLLVLSAKTAFMMVLLLSTPFMIETGFIINFWLGSIPPHTVSFTRLFMLICLVDSLSSGITDYVFARGNIRPYQLWVNIVILLSIICAFAALKAGAPAEALLVTYLAFSVFVFVAKQVILRYKYQFDISILFRKAYGPGLVVVLLSVPMYVLLKFWHPVPLASIPLSMAYVAICIAFAGFSKAERAFFKSLIVKKFNHAR